MKEASPNVSYELKISGFPNNPSGSETLLGSPEECLANHSRRLSAATPNEPCLRVTSLNKRFQEIKVGRVISDDLFPRTPLGRGHKIRSRNLSELRCLLSHETKTPTPLRSFVIGRRVRWLQLLHRLRNYSTDKRCRGLKHRGVAKRRYRDFQFLLLSV
ncbi:hypothetical protein AVEN_67776-1 [Araneus ventricosus]|uniref:Uncharacterized protein n=1 Tax=Araneus ventricosus TaxID=182803 RepID=A0A4Y2HN73_ARAVE|nr:hypothetical protein AVEN_67776-1 [Araneus ventricosus]